MQPTLNVFVQVFLAYVFVDFLSGAYHFITDKGWNFRDQVTMFLGHHDTNTMQGFDWQTFAAGMPVAVLGAWFHSQFFIAAGFFGALTQVTHYYAHVRSRSPLVHQIVRTLQQCRIIVPPKTHSRHHDEPFDRDFCLLSGWNNVWMNPMLRLLERRAAV